MLERLTGKRVILRKLKLSDADDMHEYCNDPEFARYALRATYPHKKSSSAAFIADSLKNWKKKTAFAWAIEHQGRIIGSLSLKPEEFNKASTGWGLNRKYWGLGLTTEAVRLVVDAGFKNLKL